MIKTFFGTYSDELNLEQLIEKRKAVRQMAIIYFIISMVFFGIMVGQYIWIGYIGLTIILGIFSLSVLMVAYYWKDAEGQLTVVINFRKGNRND